MTRNAGLRITSHIFLSCKFIITWEPNEASITRSANLMNVSNIQSHTALS